MGSAKELETLQVLKQEPAPEDAPSPSPPCTQENGSCLQSIRCGSGGGDLTMRNCCVNDLGAKDSSREGSMVDSAKQGEKAPGADATPSTDHLAAGDSVALKDAVAGTSVLGGGGEKAARRELQRNRWQDLSSAEPLASSSITDSALDGRASPVAGEACRRLPAESCLKGASKDLSGAPAPLKHVAFIEPTEHNTGAESTQAGEAAFSKEGVTLPACLPNARHEQPCASEGDVCEAVGGSNEGRGEPLSSAAAQKSPKPPVAEAPSGKLGELVTGRDWRDPGGGMGAPPLDSGAGLLAARPRGTSGEPLTSPGAATKEAEGLREAVPSSTQDQARAQEQAAAEAAVAAGSEEPVADVEMRPGAVLTKACSIEVTPPQQDAGTQAGHRVSLVSIAVSPINPPDGSTAFSFPTGGLGPPTSLKSPGPEQKPAKKDVEMQVSIPVETRSVATGPMTPVTKSPQASYPEVRVKGAQEEAPEPVREVSWDEKGMTWEVYGASMEVEVLGMAIQKHLEKQIEEHGRQTVMTPQSTRSSSIKGPPHKGEVKTQPSMFRALLQNVRRPRCCSRGGPAVE